MKGYKPWNNALTIAANNPKCLNRHSWFIRLLIYLGCNVKVNA